MSDKPSDLPRDLRTLCGGAVEEADGSQRVLLDPIGSYATVHEVCMELEQLISDPDTPIEEVARLRKELELVKQEQADMERRILHHFDARPPMSNPKDKASYRSKVDHGAKSKVEKAISDVKAGRYDRQKMSKTLKAVRQAQAYCQKNGRMPLHGELKDLGYNDQQATDAGKWLAIQADPEPDEESLFLPLHRPNQARPKK